jgi:2-polyprenyl-3-methyl-5-hydroxy-6-metoxy-1,4-benzoquinol methylase
VLDEVEERIDLVEVVCDNTSQEETKTKEGEKEEEEETNQQKISNNEFPNLPLNIPGESMASSRGSLTREEYLQRKKWPQIRWLLQRLHKLGNFKTVLDVGGGRGDLATAIAKEFPAVHVTVVDLNEPSLVAGREYARQLGLGDRMSFECADFAAYVRDYEKTSSEKRHPKGFDVVVALHACGDLSDLAMQFAHQIQSAFVICPCCYTKRYIDQYEPRWIQHYTSSHFCEPAESKADDEHEYEKNNHETKSSNETTQSPSTLKKPFNQGPPGIAKVPFNPSPEEQIAIVQKLAELPEQPTVSQRAMRVINSMRLNAWKEACSAVDIMVQMEQYPSEFSAKNLVLVGEKR